MGQALSGAKQARKTVVVTGAAGGIGTALAWSYGKRGARLGLLDRDEAGAQALADALASSGIEATPAACDVTDADGCANAVAQVRDRLGPVDVLINNAGLTHVAPFSQTPLSSVRRLMDVNFFGAVHCTHAALDDLVARSGRIGVISSVAGFAPLVGRTGYAASKHALHGFFDTLRAELVAAGVSVTLVCPSFTQTAFGENALGTEAQKRSRKTTGALATPEEVAEATVAGLEARRRLVLPTRLSRTSWLVSRLLPDRKSVV